MSIVSNHYFATTVNYLSNPQFAARARTFVKRPPPGKLLDGIRIFSRVLEISLREERLLLSSSWGSIHPELLAAALIGLWPRQLRPRIYLLGCMWEPDGGLRGLVERFIVRFADRAVFRYIVQSTEELAIFPQTWGVSPHKTRFCPFFYSFTGRELAAAADRSTGGYIFAGGNSLRDYEPLVEAARLLPHRRFVFATDLLDHRTDLPPNVKAGRVPHRAFISLMASSAVAVIPIQGGLHRAAGQQTYLNAMRMGKPTIVTDTLGVRDHVRDRETALIVDGSPAAYVEAIEWVLAPRNRQAVEQLRFAACRDVQERFSFERHVERLLEIIDEAGEDRAAPDPIA